MPKTLTLFSGLQDKVRFKIPTLVVTSEDNDEEFVEFIEEKLKPNVPIKNAVMMLNELFPPPKVRFLNLNKCNSI